MPHRIALGVLFASIAVWGCSSGGGSGSLTHDPAVPTADGKPAKSNADIPKGDTFYALFDTSQGKFLVAVHPGWAPLGAERFKQLVEEHYYDECRFFRVLDGFMAQVGINGEPQVNAEWRENIISDDPVLASNQRATVTFATGGPNSRTTQIFFNYGDNSMLDGQGFSPFGEVIAGMDVLDSLYKEYGEGAPNGRGPEQGRIQFEGNSYLNSDFPKLDYIRTAQIYDTEEAARAALGETAGPAADAQPADATATESAGE